MSCCDGSSENVLACVKSRNRFDPSITRAGPSQHYASIALFSFLFLPLRRSFHFMTNGSIESEISLLSVCGKTAINLRLMVMVLRSLHCSRFGFVQHFC